MRIALVTSEYPGLGGVPCGGLGHYLQRLVLALSGAGHAAEVFVPAGPGADRPEGMHVVGTSWSRAIRWASRLTLHRLAMPIDCLVQSRRLGAALAERHAAAPFDVVQYAHLGATSLAGPRGIPTVIRLSGWGPMWLRAGDGSLGGMQGRLVHRLERRALARAQVIYGPSRHLAEHVSGIIGREIAVLENPFVPECAPAEGPAPVEGRYLLSFGQINRLKGAETISCIAARILASNPGLRWVFAGRELESGRIASIRAGLADPARIIHLPHLPHPELYRLIAGSEVVVLPSLIDNLPNTCLEAMSLGACVVGTQPTGMEQVITDGESGFLAAAGDPESVALAVERAFAAGSAGRRRIGEAAQERIRRLRPEIILPRLLALYERAREMHACQRKGRHVGN